MAMDTRDYTPSCAVCGGPGEPECPHEGERLELCIDTAEKKWIESWVSTTREWVTNNAILYITNVFGQHKRVRVANYISYVTQLPNYSFYAQYHGRPPLHPQVLYQLQRQIAEAKADLRRDIDQDWKACVLRYPEVLAHYYSLISVHLPREFDPPVLSGMGSMGPRAPPAPPPPTPQSNAATAAAAAAAAVAAAGGIPPGMEMNGLGGIGIPGASMGAPPPVARPQPPSRAASQTKRSSFSSKKMSETERELYKMLYGKGEKKTPGTPGPASAAGTTHPSRRDSVRSATAPPVPMPPPFFPGVRPSG